MPTFSPEQLAHWTGGTWTVRPAKPLTAFGVDSRTLGPGDVFVALRTERRDGHDFLASAAAAGAAAALVATRNRAVSLPQLVVPDPLAAFQTIAREHRRTFRGAVVGISGSAGKTSTKDLLALLLGGASCGVVATEGNLNNHLGVPLTLTRLDPAAHRFAVIEAGINAPGDMAPLAGMIEPDVAIITLVAAAHTEQLGGLGGVAREKSVLPAAVRSGGVAIVPRSTFDYAPFRDLRVRTMVVERAAGLPAETLPTEGVFFLVAHRSEETALTIASGQLPPFRFVFRRVSDGMAQNAALAVCAALWLGVSREAIQTRFAGWKPAKLRAEVRRTDGKLLYLDCYNANPASMADALSTFETLAPAGEPRLYVLGCMEELGPDAPALHRALGRSLRLRDGDRLFVIGTLAHEVGAGLLELGDFSRQLQIVSSLEPVSVALAAWRGAVFVKGSRRYQLERILEAQTSLPLPC